MKRYILFFIVIVFGVGGFAQSKEVPFTLEDRDRIIKMEERLKSIDTRISSLENELNGKITSLGTGLNGKITSLGNELNGKITSLRNEMNTKFEAVDKKLDILYWGFGIIITLILFLFGYIIFDRRKTIRPLEQDVSVIKYRQDNLSTVIREFAEKDKKFAEALKKVAF